LKIKNLLFTLALLFIGNFVFAQFARVKGIILDENNNPIENVNISYQTKSTITNANGFYSLAVPANKKITLIFTHISLKKTTATLELKANEDFEFNVTMNDNAEQMGEVIVTAKNRKRIQGITTIEPEMIRKIPGANAGVENILKTLPGVYSNNELSTQYAVRGGNYDENLV